MGRFGVNVGVPAYRSMHPDMVLSLMGLVLHSRDRLNGYNHRHLMYVDRARNELAAQAADDPHCTHLLFLDDDHVFGPDTLDRLLAHDRPVVGGMYFHRNHPHACVAGDFVGSGKEYRPLRRLPHGLCPVGVLGMGCTLVRASVLRDMRARFDDQLWFRSGECGEDVWFFDRLRQMGVDAFVDASLIIGHIGEGVVTDEHWRKTHTRPADPEGPDGYPPDFTDLYAEAVQMVPPGGQMVEVGCYLGRSLIVLLQLLRRAGKLGRVRVAAVDHFHGSDETSDPPETGDSAARHRLAAVRGGGSFLGEFLRNLEEAGFSSSREDGTHVVNADSVVAAATFTDGSCDFVFLDGSHDQPRATADLLAWLPKVRPGGVLAGHDYNWPGVRAAVDALLPDAVPKSRASWWWRKPE